MKVDNLIFHLITLGYPKADLLNKTSNFYKGSYFYFEDHEEISDNSSIIFVCQENINSNDLGGWGFQFFARDNVIYFHDFLNKKKPFYDSQESIPETLKDVKRIIEKFKTCSIGLQQSYEAQR
tara:strand:+ start:125 stop:493 length:369 start_codon:yes stop_codon:yes gene_type:complete